MSQPRKPKKEYTLQEDTMITARALVNIVLSTREDLDPIIFVAPLLEAYAQRVQTKYSVGPTQPVPSRPRRRQVESGEQ